MIYTNVERAETPKNERNPKGFNHITMKKPFLLMVMCIFTTFIVNAVPSYYYEAAVFGKWNLFSLPEDMAMQAYLDQKAGKGGGFWGVAIRSMFTTNRGNKDLNNYIPSADAKRTIIYRHPSGKKSGADYWAQQFADLGIFGGIMLLLVGGLIVFVVWKLLKSSIKG